MIYYLLLLFIKLGFKRGFVELVQQSLLQTLEHACVRAHEQAQLKMNGVFGFASVGWLSAIKDRQTCKRLS